MNGDHQVPRAPRERDTSADGESATRRTEPVEPAPWEQPDGEPPDDEGLADDEFVPV
jgi:hypothetical protein